MTNSVHYPTDLIKEEIVNYQHPFLFLKIWEIQSDRILSGFPEIWPWHYHKEVEFLIVTNGSIGIQTENDYHTLIEGDIMLLGTSQLHRTHKATTSPLSFIVFQVDLSQHFDQSSMPYLHCFSELTEPLSKLNYVFSEYPAIRQQAYSLVQEIYKESQERQRGYELAIGSAIKRLLWLLLRNDTRGILPGIDESDLIRLRPVLDYVEHNLMDKITIEDVSSLLNFSYHYFIRYFRTTMGLSFIEFVNYKRIKKAERLLLTRNLSIMEIACEVGIPSMAQFYKLFKRYNQCSPKDYKRRMSGQSGVNDHQL